MSREHAKIDKAIINFDVMGDRHIICGWDDCERDGYEVNQVRVNYGTASYPQVTNYVFCTERHRQFWINSHRGYGKLPPGFKRSFI